jgi:hypothetical protein
MGKIIRLNLELSTNGSCIVENLIKTGNIMTKPEIEKFSFNSSEELSAWIFKKLNGGE